MKVTVQHVLPISPEDYWQTLYASRTFIEALYIEGLGARDLLISEWEQAASGAFNRRLSFNPKMNAPRAVKKILGDAFRCEERGHFDPNTQRWHFVYKSSPLSEKLTITGGQYVEAHPRGCTLHCHLEVGVSIFGVAKLVEKTIVTQFEADMQAQANFIHQWVKRSAG